MASGAGEESKKLKLYSYWRSPCSQRVRIALNLKGLDYKYVAVNLSKKEQNSPVLKLNPLGRVPVLVDGDYAVADSDAILWYLEKRYPQPPLLPRDPQKKALHFQAANIVNAASIIIAGIEPYLDLTTAGYFFPELGQFEFYDWGQLFLRKRFTELEKLLENRARTYATGDEVFWADLFLAPFIDVGITTFKIDMNEFPTLLKLHESYKLAPAFKSAMPGKQPDTPPEEQD